MQDKCPVCGSEESDTLDVSSVVSASIVGDAGRVRIIACLDCGVLYLDAFDREQIKDVRKKRKEWAKKNAR